MRPHTRHPLVESTGLSQEMLASVGAIAVVSAHIESFVETCIWELDGMRRNEKTGALDTDQKPISWLIEHFGKLGARHDVEIVRKLILAWCRAAPPCFKCRNNLFHGTAFGGFGDGWIEFRNKWPILPGTSHVIERKPGASTFHASDNTLGLLEEAFKYLYDGLTVTWTAIGLRTIDQSLADDWIGKMGSAWSIGAELKDLAAAVNDEKY